ncbi:uncharacterized protein LOC125027167 isoform X2 [Penaeus chinensis]|uniref:uncharacterized protein LOC125027167 isoform X2 n=1 Tax=Penaeus chinensis TaxID=139456 RepID=UPI001FB7A2DB|nr:uncharacterized protein LOC125027167 isoform X2 [Penaeus chinensis]
MEGTRSLLSDRLEAPKPHFSLRLEDASPLLPDRGKSPLTLAMDASNSHLSSVAESFKSHFPPSAEGAKSLLQDLEGTMALLAARGAEGAKAMYPMGMEGLRSFLPYGGEGVKSYLHERMEKPHKAVRERRESSKGTEGSGNPESGEGKRCQQHERPREAKSGSARREASPMAQQLSNPRHDAHLVHAIRELHEEEFGLDAVLLAEGGHVGAHCAVLAAASPFLKTLLLHANDHPAIISVTGTTLATLQALVTCLYTGSIPADASLYNLTEAAKLLKMDDLATVLQKTLLAQGGSLLDVSKSYSSLRPSSGYTSLAPGSGQELRIEKTGKKIRSNRLDQILYQKLNVNHLAPSDIPDPTHVPPQDPPHVPPPESPRVPVLDSSRVPPPDPRGGILGELLTKADPLRTVFSTQSAYSIADLGFDSSGTPLRPLNLSKPNKSHSPSSTSSISSSYSTSSVSSPYTSSLCSTSSTTTTSCSLSSSNIASQSDINLSTLSSLASAMPAGSMSGLLTSLTPSSLPSMMSQSALASLATSSTLASLAAQHSSIPTSPSKSKSSPNFMSNRSRSSSKSSCSGRSTSRLNSSSNSNNNRKSSQHSLPLLYTLKGGIMTPEVAKEVYEQLKLNPQLATLTGFNNLHNMSSLSSSSSLQNLAGLHNLSSLQSFPSLFPFLAPVSTESSLASGSAISSGGKKSQTSPVPPSSEFCDANTSSVPNTTTNDANSVQASSDEPHVALNLSSSATTTRSESPDVVTVEDSSVPVTSANGSITQPSTLCVTVDDDEKIIPVSQTTPVTDVIANGPTSLCHNSVDGTIDVVGSNEDGLPSVSVAAGLGHGGIVSLSSQSSTLDGSSLPLLLMSSGSALSGLAQSQSDIKAIADLSPDSQGALQLVKTIFALQDSGKLAAELVETCEDIGIEVVDEIPGINRCHVHARKTLYHAGHMGRKRKGCGECEGCQVVEDCGQCRFCRDKAKFGGPNRLKQVCVYKRCVLAEMEPEDSKKRRKSSGKKGRGKCGGCDGCQRTSDCGECYACLHNAAAQPPARRKVCEMRVCEQQQMEEVRAALSVAGEPSPYSTDSLMAESLGMNSGTSSPTPDGQPSTHNDKMKLMRKMLKKKFAQPYSRVRTKYYCGECPGCLTTTPCGNCLYCEDMPKFGGPGRYRQKCVKQLCVYHPRLQALKLSNRSKLTYDEQHIAQETLSHLACAPEGAIHLECEVSPMSREHLEETESIEEIEQIDETDGVTEGEDSNAMSQVRSILESISAKAEMDEAGPITKVESIPLISVTPEPVISEREALQVPADVPVSIDTPGLAEEEQPTRLATEEGEEDLEEVEEDEEDDDELVSEASDVPSPPSTPSPRPRVRGRKHNRGRGRGRGKLTRASLARLKKATRRGRRRRTPRFTLGPEDHSDYEDEIMLVETGESVVEEPSASDKCETKGDSDLQPLNDVSTKDINNGQGTKEKPTNIPAAEKIEDQGYSKSSTVEVKGDIRTVHKVDLMFQESQVNVSQNPSENTDSVSHKHNGPYVFHDEESSQGGRDVNENLGSVSETASA